MLLTKDFVNGCVRWQCTVEDVELSLETLWDVITSSSRLDHSSHQLNISNDGEITWFLQVVESTHFHHLTHDLIGNLGGRHTMNTVMIAIC